MSNELGKFRHKRPESILKNQSYARQTWESGLMFNGSAEPELIHFAYKIIETAQKIGPRVCALPENSGNKGFMIGITKNEPNFPVLTVQIGGVNKKDFEYGKDGKRLKYVEFVNKKAQVIQMNPGIGLISSGENKKLPEKWRIKSSKGVEIPDGAIVFGEYIIITSAFKNAKMDTAVSLAMATGAGLITRDGAEKLAHDPRVACVKEYMSRVEDILFEEVLH